MHDIRSIREAPEAFDRALARRGLTPMSQEILAIDAARRHAISEAEVTKAANNDKSRELAEEKRRGDAAAFESLRLELSVNKETLRQLEGIAKNEDEKLAALLRTIPNLPDDDVPDGADETANVELRRRGSPRAFDFAPREHFEIPSVAPLMDFEAAARLSGSRFVVLKGALVRLHRALASFMLDTHTTENGLEEVWTPVLVRDEALIGTGQLPKFADDLYRTETGWWLIPTAEVTLTNLVAGEIVEEASLPRRWTAWTQCFRSEAGSAGRDTRGMLRQHQFEKVEMVSVTRPEDSRTELDRMTRCAEGILERLGLPYRTIVLCTGDMGFGARRTHDIEVWLPGQDTYREISSCSVCGDFQARRMNARFRRAETKRPDFVHTLNGSGLAVGRTLIAVLENGQEADGSVTLPPALAPWLGGAIRIDPKGRLA